MQVYLSKSNLACPYLVDKVRRIILDSGYKVAEHHNLDKYTHSLLLESDALVIVPAKEVLSASYPYRSYLPQTSLSNPRCGYYIGKGQYEQFKAFMDYNKAGSSLPEDMKSIMCVEGLAQNATSNLEVNIARLHSLEHKINGDWKVSYAFAELTSPYLSLERGLHKALVDVRMNSIKGGNVFSTQADTIISTGKPEMSDFDKKLAEVRGFHDPSRAKGVRSECFDGVPHLACRMLYNL